LGKPNSLKAITWVNTRSAVAAGTPRAAAPSLNSSQNPAISSRLRRRLMARRSASAWPGVNPASAWHTCSTWS